jgi:hypothetical protein
MHARHQPLTVEVVVCFGTVVGVTVVEGAIVVGGTLVVVV